MRYIIGVDVGATKISAGLMYGHTVPKMIVVPTEAHTKASRVIQNIFKAIAIFDNPKIHSIGLAVAGALDKKKGIALSSPNMPKDFKNIPLKRLIQKRFQKTTHIENDARCFTLAESVYGAGKNYGHVIGLTLGTGIGGGIVIEKKIYAGGMGLAGEFGHMTVVENGYVCSCSRRGHLEAYASGKGMVNLFKTLSGKTLDTYAIEALAAAGDKNALRVLHIMSEALGIGIANIIHTLNPNIIVLGGGLLNIKNFWKRAIKIAQREIIFTPSKKTKIVPSVLKEKAHIIGAALIAQKEGE